MSSLAIVTKYLGYTDGLSSRIKATARTRKEFSDGAVLPGLAATINYDQGLSTEVNHCNAAKALAEKLGWHGLYVCGGMPDGSGNCYVRLPQGLPVEFAPAYLGVENYGWFFVKER